MEKDKNEELKFRPASRILDAGKQEESEEVLSTEVTDEDLADAVEDEFGAKYSKDGKRLLLLKKGGLPSLSKVVETYEIREGTRVICDRAFECCQNLRSVVIPSSVTRIGDWAFADCWKLKSVVIPSSVTRIGDRAFALCLSLQYVVIPSGVTRIGDGAFFRCQSLQFVVIPSSVTQIGNSVFEVCDSLQLIGIPKGSREKFEKMLWSYNNIDELLVEI